MLHGPEALFVDFNFGYTSTRCIDILSRLMSVHFSNIVSGCTLHYACVYVSSTSIQHLLSTCSTHHIALASYMSTISFIHMCTYVYVCIGTTGFSLSDVVMYI